MRALLIALATIATLSVAELAVPIAEVSAQESTSSAAATSQSGSVQSGSVQGVDINVGDQLQATRDVSLDEAIIAVGSKISVSGKRKTGGRVLLDVALADGHVVRGVPLVEIRKSFRPVK